MAHMQTHAHTSDIVGVYRILREMEKLLPFDEIQNHYTNFIIQVCTGLHIMDSNNFVDYISRKIQYR